MMKKKMKVKKKKAKEKKTQGKVINNRAEKQISRLK